MKRILMLLLIIASIPIYSFSQSIYPTIVQDSLILITKEQLKQTNLIFLEHSKFKKKLNLLENKNLIQAKQIKILHKSLDLNGEIINNQEQINKINVDFYKKELKRSKIKAGCFMIGGITVSATLLILLWMK